MPDPKQDQQGAVPAASSAPGKVRLRHPNTGDVKEVNAVPEAMIPLLGRGYQQVKE